MKSYPAYKHSGVPWLGEIPEHWAVRPLRTLMRRNELRGFPKLTLLSVVREKGIIVRNTESKEENHNFIPDDLSKYKLVRRGQFVINKMKAWQGSYGISDYEGIVSPAYYVYSMDNSSLLPAFFHTAIRSMAYIPFFSKYSDGVRIGQWDLDETKMKKITFCCPPLSEQAAIASYLDRKCGEIDEMVRRRQAIIERLRELKQALIAKAVTKGLQPDVPMKDSGIPWLGEIPEGWSVQPLKYMFSFRKGLPITKADLIDEGLPVISYGQVHSRDNSGTRLTEQLLRYVSPDYAVSYPNAAVPINSFIIADTSEDLEGCGNCVYNDSIPNLFAGYHSIILNTISRNSARYFAYLFKSDTWRKQIRTAVSGVKVFSISRRILKACSLLVPPLPEQAAIVAYLDKKCAAIDELISRHGQIVEKLRELKASAIAHVVTGKIDIREGA